MLLTSKTALRILMPLLLIIPWSSVHALPDSWGCNAHKVLNDHLIDFETTFVLLDALSDSETESADSIRSAELYSQARTFQLDASYDSAELMYTQAMDQFKSIESWNGWLESLYQLGMIAYEQRQYQKGDSIFRKGLHAAERWLDEPSNISIRFGYGRMLIKEEVNEFDSALYLANLALDELKELDNPDTAQQLKLLGRRATTYMKLGLYSKAIDDWSLYVDQVEKNDQDEATLALAYEQLGYIHGLAREFTQSDAYLARALEYRMKHQSKKGGLIRLARLYNSIGGSYLRSRRLVKAREAYKKAHKIAKDKLGENSRGAIYTLANIGSTFIEHQDDSAFWYLSRALEKERMHMPDQKFVLANTLLNLGMAQMGIGQYEQARISYRQTLSNITQTTSGFHIYKSKSYNQLGDISMKLGLLDSAEFFFEKAIQHNLIREQDGLTENLGSYLDLANLVTTIHYQARFTILKNRKQTLDSTILNQMLRKVDLGINLIHTFLDDISINSGAEDKLTEMLHELNLSGGELARLLYHMTSQERYNALLLNYAELDRAWSLRALISKENTIKLANIADTAIAKLHAFDQKVNQVRAKLISGSSQEASDWEQLQELSLGREKYYESLKTKYPLLEQLNEKVKSIDIDEIRSFLGDNQVFVEYFIGKKMVYAILVTPQDLEVFELMESDKVEGLVNEQKKGILSRRTNQFQEASFRCYEALYSPLDRFLSERFDPGLRVLVVPDGAINFLSFSALVRDTITFSPLMDQYTFSYSASAYVAMQRKSRTSAKDGSLLAFASDFSTLGSPKTQTPPLSETAFDLVRDVLRPLPGVIRELDLISDVFPSTMVFGDEATESSFKQEASRFGAIHLATHAIVNHDQPDLSKLLFQIDEKGPEDGELHAYEIYNLTLNADLVTLSACNTGFGTIKKGEGVMSLSRAFAYAGVPATVVSLWPASDKTTPELMKHFYHNLREGQTKDVALNNARKAYLSTATGKARHPFYWGGFVLIGNSAAIKGDTDYWLWVFSLAPLLAFALVLVKRKL